MHIKFVERRVGCPMHLQFIFRNIRQTFNWYPQPNMHFAKTSMVLLAIPLGFASALRRLVCHHWLPRMFLDEMADRIT